MVRALTNLKKQKNSGNADEQIVAKKVSKRRARAPKMDTVDTMSDASLDTSDEEFSGVELETPRRSSRNRLPSSRYCPADFVLSSSSSQEEDEEDNNPKTPEDALIPAFGRRQCPAQAEKEAQPSNASA